MKKALAIILCLLLTISMCSCSVKLVEDKPPTSISTEYAKIVLPEGYEFDNSGGEVVNDNPTPEEEKEIHKNFKNEDCSTEAFVFDCSNNNGWDREYYRSYYSLQSCDHDEECLERETGEHEDFGEIEYIFCLDKNEKYFPAAAEAIFDDGKSVYFVQFLGKAKNYEKIKEELKAFIAGTTLEEL